MQKNTYRQAKKKNFILPVLTSLVLISCAVFTLCVYNRSRSVKALEDLKAENNASLDATAPDGPVSPPAINDNSSLDGTGSTSNESSTVTPGSSGTKTPASGELHGIWISFLDYSPKGYTRASFTKHVQTMFDNCKSKNFDTVFVHVRMFSDAMYNSKYFPWSKYSSGKIGKSPGFDPLQIMVTEAHSRGLKIHAWINPYRITKDTTSNSALAKSSYAYKWRNSKSPSLRRNVLNYGGQLYFNPSKQTVQNLIINGVKEIVKNYDVDGIHFDDYFYPNLGTAYRKNFDAKEYNTYAKKCRKNGTAPLSIVTWRRNNVSKLIKNVYSAVKKIDKNCIFGISPAGNINNLYLNNNYYCDVKKWMGNPGYIDYICPQIYWSFKHPSCPYKATLKTWTSVKKHKNVKLYTGLAAYRAGISSKEAKAIGDKSWSKSNTILKRQIQYSRNTGDVSGFIFFDYADLERSSARKEIKNATNLFK